MGLKDILVIYFWRQALTIVIMVFMASAVASSLEGVSTKVLPKYLRVNLASEASSVSCPVLKTPLFSTHSRLFAKAHSSHSSENNITFSLWIDVYNKVLDIHIYISWALLNKCR